MDNIGLYIDYNNFLAETLECLEGRDIFFSYKGTIWTSSRAVSFSKTIGPEGRGVTVQMSMDRKKRRMREMVWFLIVSHSRGPQMLRVIKRCA